MTRTILLGAAALLATTMFAAAAPLGQFTDHQDIGKPRHPGSASYDARTHAYRITGGGQNMWANHDDFHYVWKKMSGDVRASVDLTFVSPAPPPGAPGVIHRKGGTRSTQLFKNVAGGGARAVYQGKVTVAKGADGSDSLQTAKALLLSETAEADLKPELEIFADDVKCAHGAAVGDLDADSLFYLRTRGIPEAEARALLIHAFLEDALAEIAAEDMRSGVREAVGAALAGLA